MNTFGTLFRVTTFGESHGPAIGAVVDGCPAGLPVSADYLQAELARRRPGQSRLTTQRREADMVEILSGVFEGRTTGTPVALLIRNENARSKDYAHLKDTFRPSHADYTYQAKYGHRDYRGGGRSSARETAARVAAGAIAKLLLSEMGVTVRAYVSQVGDLVLAKPYQELDLSLTETNPVRCPDPATAERMAALIDAVRKDRDTIGGVVTGVATGLPAGWGAPVFGKLPATLGAAMLGINAVKGFEFGSGFAGVALRGSQHNDLFEATDDRRPTGFATADDRPPTAVPFGSTADSRPTTADSSEATDDRRPPMADSSKKKQHESADAAIGGQPSPVAKQPALRTQSNRSGGTQGGISNGEDVYFRVAFKPVATIMQDQPGVNARGEATVVAGKGRHDPCVLPRAVPIVEAMTALVLADAWLQSQTDRLDQLTSVAPATADAAAQNSAQST